VGGFEWADANLVYLWDERCATSAIIKECVDPCGQISNRRS
jgi:hypothetical protein